MPPSKSAPPPLGQRWYAWVWVPVGLITFLVFSPSLRNDFVLWDDQENILLNFHFRGLTWAHLRWMFTAFHMGHYTPLAWLTLAVDFKFWGMNPLGYHLTSLVLHSANAVLFYFVSRRLLALARPQEARANPGLLACAAGLSALLFSVHPLRVESVAWVTERRDVLTAFFFLLSFLTYLRYATVPPSGSRRAWTYAACLTFFFLSLLSKTSGMALPLILLVVDVYPLRRPLSGRMLWEKVPFAVLAIPVATLAYLATVQGYIALTFKELSFLQRIGLASYGVIFYLQQTLLPLNLSALYEVPRRLFGPLPPLGASLFFTLFLSFLFVATRKKWPALLAVWLCYLALLAPTSGLAQSGPQIAADRYTYLACLGLALLGGSLVLSIKNRRMQFYLQMISMLALFALSSMAQKQTRVWQDERHLWSYAVEADPRSPSANAYLAGAAMRDGELDIALGHAQNALILEPESDETNYFMGCILMRLNQDEEAMRFFRHSLQVNPRHVSAGTNLAALLLKVHRIAEARALLEKAYETDPENAEVHINLGCADAMEHRMDAAMQHFTKALELNPESEAAQENIRRAMALAPH